MRLYTADNGWFLKEETSSARSKPGKLGDLVVLSDDYFNPRGARRGDQETAVRADGRRRQGGLQLAASVIRHRHNEKSRLPCGNRRGDDLYSCSTAFEASPSRAAPLFWAPRL